MSSSLTLGHRPGLFRLAYRVSPALQLRHMALFGPTGSGKSTQLLNLASQNAALPSHPGFLLIDLKDTLAYDAAMILPAFRESDVLLFDASDRGFPPAFNPLANVPEEHRTLAASELVAAFKRLWGDSWGPRIEHVLRNAALTLLETPDATLLDIARLLTDERYRDWTTRQVTNFSVRSFWEREFLSIVGTKGSVANVESLLNKLSILSYPEIRNIVGQTNRGLDLFAAMNAGHIVLAHLPQGVLGEDAATFLASLLVARTQLAAQRRVTQRRGARKTFLLFADECQNYDISSFNKLITEGRSMAVGVIAACQFEEQLPSPLRQTILHNCALKLVCSAAGGRHTVEVIYLQVDPAPEVPLVLRAQPPRRASDSRQLEYIRARSRRVLAQPRAAVEADIERRLTEEPRHGKRARFYED